VEPESLGPKFSPPYNIAWSTLRSFLERIDLENLPPRIDRSYLPTLSGTAQSYLIGALRSFELIGPNREVLPALKELAQDPDGRPALIGDLLRKYYPEVVELGENNGTAGQLEEAFRKYGLAGNTVRKAVTFYVHAAQYAGLPLSPHWHVRKAGSGYRDASSVKRPRKPTSRPAAPIQQTSRTPAGDSRSLALKSGGTVTLAVSVNLFELSKEDRNFVLKLIDEMSDYDQEASKQPSEGLRPEHSGPHRVVPAESTSAD
jgi:hypothetical protein